MYLRIIRMILLLSISVNVFSQNTAVFRMKAYEHAAVSVCVLDLKTAKTVVQYNEALSVTPASVVKLLTTAAALEMLGPDHRFETELLYTGTIAGGTLVGDLWIRGGGDPSLGSRQISGKQEGFLADWVNAVKAAGINRIEGRILADATLFDEEGISPFWLWEDIGNYYATGIYGLNVFDNSFKLELKSGAPGTCPEIVSVLPPIPGLTIENHLLSADNALDSAYLYGAPFQSDMRLFGTMPADRVSFTIRGQMPDPPTYLALRLAEELRRSGVGVSGAALSLRTLNTENQAVGLPKTSLFKTTSPPLSQIIRVIHEKSDNFYTECLLRHLALTASTKPATAREGIRVVREFWKNKGMDLSALILFDASGLSPNDRVSAGFLARLLRHTAQDEKLGKAFEESLPLAGVEGTVSGFLKNTPLEGQLRLKSGSNQMVNSYAGFYRKNGKSYAVVMMVNGADATRFQIRKDLETFLLSL